TTSFGWDGCRPSGDAGLLPTPTARYQGTGDGLAQREVDRRLLAWRVRLRGLDVDTQRRDIVCGDLEADVAGDGRAGEDVGLLFNPHLRVRRGKHHRTRATRIQSRVPRIRCLVFADCEDAIREVERHVGLSAASVRDSHC